MNTYTGNQPTSNLPVPQIHKIKGKPCLVSCQPIFTRQETKPLLVFEAVGGGKDRGCSSET